ncbi:phosphonoacetate hydrolase [Roseomonas aerophila]|uniref:Phosphonoacetate hydrolase n=1 Tax=Teichococcus aerophilus TaxID=1224513 RepID=A0ABR7RLI0_9PROT|nr:phosphonoacetate hydrolase [Pseudoroseomonas aerophila]MBC9207407.1 phosphonoacetate hydrolase [Pseudoroseomonas aerophila]
MQLVIETRTASVDVNGRTYRLPQRPVAVICFDGCDPAYLETGFKAGDLPFLARCAGEGFGGSALAAMPTFTNPNNASLVTGVEPGVHGVSGNYYLDRVTGETVMVTGDAEMRAPTILAAMAAAGVPTAVVTAKDKLRAALAKGLPIGRGIAVSAQHAASVREETHGIGDLTALLGQPEPDQYSAELSLFVLDTGIALARQGRSRLMYLSLSDYVQHRHAPDSAEARAFMRAVDERLGKLAALGCLVATTADHGMTDMARSDGSPEIVFVGDVLDARFGPGATRVICPITDPFVRHHGALGGLVRVHLRPGPDAPDLGAVLATLRDEPRLMEVLPGAEACARYGMAPHMEGDLTVIARRGVALGGRATEHDLSQLAGERLRSHGGLAEQAVPFLLSEPLRPEWLHAHPRLRNFDIFDAALNGVETER